MSDVPLEKLTQIPPSIAAVADYEPLARERMSAQAWAYMAGGAADELTLANNHAAFQRIQLRTRVLADLSGGNTHLRLFGQAFAHPILLAPVAYQRLVHADGELATVLAASAVQAGMVLSTQASVSVEAVAEQARTPLWFQLYIQPDRAFTHALVKRTEAAGYQALVLTVDAPVNGMRNREQRAGFCLPEGIEAVNLRGMRPLRERAPPSGGLLLGSELLAAAPGWADVQWLRTLTHLPILLKGVMTAEDAQRALAEGVDGIIVSNHGGRTLDGQPATIEVLADIAAALQGRIPLLLDGGIRRGTDVFKALALGADAVMVGRPYIYGLATAGASGVAHVVQLLRAELEVAMALTGCRDLAGITPDRVLLKSRL